MIIQHNMQIKQQWMNISVLNNNRMNHSSIKSAMDSSSSSSYDMSRIRFDIPSHGVIADSRIVNDSELIDDTRTCLEYLMRFKRKQENETSNYDSDGDDSRRTLSAVSSRVQTSEEVQWDYDIFLKKIMLLSKILKRKMLMMDSSGNNNKEMEVLKDLFDPSIVKVVIDIMKYYENDLDVIRSCFVILDYTSRCDIFSDQANSNSNNEDIVIESMQEHKDDPDIYFHGCSYILQLIQHGKADIDELKSKNIVNIVRQAKLLSPSNPIIDDLQKMVYDIIGEVDELDKNNNRLQEELALLEPPPEMFLQLDITLSTLLTKRRRGEDAYNQDVPKTISQAEQKHSIAGQKELFTCFCCQKSRKSNQKPDALYVATSKGVVFKYNYITGMDPLVIEIDPGNTIFDIDCAQDETGSDVLIVLSRQTRVTICALPIKDQTVRMDVLHKVEYNSLGSPISCVRIDPYFSRSSLSYIYGTHDGRVSQHKKGWIQSETVIYAPQTSGYADTNKKVDHISWSADCNVVAWNSETFAGVFDMTALQMIHVWHRPQKAEIDLMQHLQQDPKSSFVSWSHEPPNVSILYIQSERQTRIIKLLVEKDKYREYIIKIDNIFDIELAAEFTILGICPFTNVDRNDSLISVLCKGRSSEIWISIYKINDAAESTVELSKIKLPSIFQTERIPRLACEWTHGLPVQGTYFILYEEQLVIGRSASTIDKLNWFLENERLNEALSLASTSFPSKNQQLSESESPQTEELVERFLRNLVQKELYDQAANFLPRLLGRDKQAWTKCTALFAERRKLTKIASSIPTHDPQLPEYIYELALQEFADNKDYLGCLQTLRSWESVQFGKSNQPTFLNVESLLTMFSLLSKQLPLEPILHDILADLLAMNGHHNLAVREYIKAAELSNFPPALAMPQEPTDSFSYARRKRSERAFLLIKSHMLLPALTDQVKGLFLLDVEEAVSILTADDILGGFEEGGIGITPEIVFEQLSSRSSNPQQKRQPSSLMSTNNSNNNSQGNMDWALFRYLHSIFRLRQQDYNSERFAYIHTKHVELYAKYEPSKVLEFLQISTFYSIDKALDIARRHKPKPLYDAIVYLLGRMGGTEHTHEALRILIDDIRDIPRAIEFVEEQVGDNHDLWVELIKRSVKNYSLLSDLLENAGCHKVDLVLLIKELPRGVKIPNLKYSLTRIFENVQLQLHTLEASNLVIKSDVMGLLRQLHQRYQSAIRIDPKHARCRKCGGHIIPNKVIKDMKSSHYRENNHLPIDDNGDVLIFHNGECCHKFCNDELKKTRWESHANKKE